MTDKTSHAPDPRTKLVQADIGTDSAYGAVSPPLYLSTTYKFNGFDDMGAYDYGRGGNPNRDALGHAIAELEGGARGVVTASGMAAIDLVTNLIHADDLVIAPHDCYGGTHRLLTHRAKQGRLRVLFIDQNDETALEQALSQNPKLVMIETPSNPLMRLVDIRRICTAAQSVGAKVAVDNTFLSPARQRPLALGADFVLHSTTKFLNGHSDVVGGAIVSKTEKDGDALAWWANCTGVTGAPFDSFLTLRGMRTLHARMDIQERNAMAIAKMLQSHSAVQRVYYPGLPSDAGHALMQTQQSGAGAILSFELADHKAVPTLLESTTLFQLAESLGGVESLMSHPATMTHRSMDETACQIAGIRENLIRISAGMEAEADLIEDLRKNLP